MSLDGTRVILLTDWIGNEKSELCNNKKQREIQQKGQKCHPKSIQATVRRQAKTIYWIYLVMFPKGLEECYWGNIL